MPPSLLPRVFALRAAAGSRLYSTTIETVPLSFARHDPPSSDKPSPSSPPLVILHGLFGSKQNNRSISKSVSSSQSSPKTSISFITGVPQAPLSKQLLTNSRRAFAKDLNTSVFALDLRNHGESPHIDRHDYEAMSADVEQFLEQNRLENSILMGHSMGAKAAMALSLRRPDLISKLISVDNAPVDAILHSSFGHYVRAMERIENSQVKKQSEADLILQEVEKNIGVRQFLLTNLTKPPGQEFMKFRVPVGILKKALDRVGGFPFHPDRIRCTKPALFVRGTKSHYVPDEVIPLIGRFYPNFTVKDIDAGHWVMSEKPNEFKTTVLEWLAKENED
ncbi:abhydrolase domain-containing protein [Pyronema omphalodes]|nr:abhydrolase domain-containing protein [Pyronema omphalodes]